MQGIESKTLKIPLFSGKVFFCFGLFSHLNGKCAEKPKKNGMFSEKKAEVLLSGKSIKAFKQMLKMNVWKLA